jgi:hypothetical protein
MPRQSKSEEVVMAGDGGRVPDVSEQRALAEFQEGLTRALNEHGVPAMPSWQAAIDWLAEHGGRIGSQGPAATSSARIRERIEAKRPHHVDPASVLAALLAESPEATVAAIEALLTSDEAGEAISDFFDGGYRSHWCAEWQAEGRCQLCVDAAQMALSAACRSLLSKAPKEHGDA